MDAEQSPVQLFMVASGSTRNVRDAMIGNSSVGKPKKSIMMTAPIIPAPGMADVTTPQRTQIKIELAQFPIPVKG